MQIYFDFSGYSDMAIGMGKMLGFDFLENFNYPYISRSVRDFWRRWHISLSSWFKDYLYIPMGGNRHGAARTCVNLLVVFGLCGFWHGANWTFLLWGLYHGIFLSLERLPLFKRLNACTPWPLGILYTLVVVVIGWVLFRSDTIAEAWTYLLAMFGRGGGVRIVDLANSRVYLSMAAGVLCALPIVPRIRLLLSKSTGRLQALSEVLSALIAIALLVICSVLLAAGTYNPFIYFRF